MKKTLFAIIALLAIACSSSQAKLLQFGVEGGMNINRLSFSSDMFSSTNRLGFLVGPKMKINIPLLGFGGDVALLYSYNNMKLDSYTTSDNEVIPESSKSLSYIQIPLNARYNFNLSALTIYIATGPQFNWCLNSTGTLDELASSTGLTYERTSWAWNIGAGVELFNHLQIGATYSFPISTNGNVNLSSVLSGVLGTTTSTSSRTGSIRLAYFF